MRRLLIALAALFALVSAPAFAGSITLLGVGKAPAAGGGGGSPPAFAWATQGIASSGVSTVTTSKSSNTITVGDLLVAVLALTDNSGTNHSVACPTGGWTPAFTANYDGNTNFAECWKIAGAGDTGGAFAFTWTTNITQPGQWTLMDFTGANASTPFDASAVAGNSAVGPSVTSLGSNRLLISCSTMAGSSVSVTSKPPALANLFTASSGANIRTQCASMTMPTAGASGTQTWTWSAGNPAQTFNSVIAP